MEFKETDKMDWRFALMTCEICHEIRRCFTGEESKTTPADYLLKFRSAESDIDEETISKRNRAWMTLLIKPPEGA